MNKNDGNSLQLIDALVSLNFAKKSACCVWHMDLFALIMKT